MEDERAGAPNGSELPPNSELPNGEPANGGRRNWIALIFVVVLAAVAILVANALIKEVRLQNCVLSGRHDCLDVAPTQ